MNGVKVRFCHQLDYATSGVLCVARSRKAAADACKLFADRKTTKEYLAILDGHVPFPDAAYAVADVDLKRSGDRPRKRRKVKSPSACFNVAKRNAQKAAMRGESLTSHQELIMSMRWSDAKKKSTIRRVYDEESAHDAVLVKREVAAPLQPFSSTAVLLDSGRVVYRIYGSITSTDGFKMALGTSESPGKFCETEIEVMSHGHIEGRAATRVIMRPKSGRRHQLRIHTRWVWGIQS